jgi:hypothetical protein
MPRGAADKLNTMLALGETFRGLCLYIERTAADNGRLSFRFVEEQGKRPKMPEDREPMESLLAMWGIHEADQEREFSAPGNRIFSSNGVK